MSEIFSDIRNDAVNGTDADDVIVSSGNTSSINGGSGNDSITASGYLVTADGGKGDDFIYLTNSYIAALGGEGNDIIMVGNGTQDVHIANVTLTGGAGKDTFAFSPSDHTISADIKDFNPDEDSIVIVRDRVTSDDDLSTLGSELIIPKEHIDTPEPPEVLHEELGYNYNASGAVDGVFANSFKERINFNFEGFTNLSDIQNIGISYLNIKDMSMTYSTFKKLNLPVQINQGLSNYDEKWLVVYSDFADDVWLGDSDWNGNNINGWSDASLNSIKADEDTVSGRMLAGNSNDNAIYAGSGGASM